METYDIVMLAVLGVATILGAWKGMAWQVASLGAVLSGEGLLTHSGRKPFE